jgi:glucose/arabinose dehydrogenase
MRLKRLAMAIALILPVLFLISCNREIAVIPEIGDIDDLRDESLLEEKETNEPEFFFLSPQDAEESFWVREAFEGIEFEMPLDIQNAGDESNRLFIVEKRGRIYYVLADEPAEAHLFLDIESRVNDSGYEEGLLGLAFHPDFSKNGYFYVNYTDASSTVISRFSIKDREGSSADPESEYIILKFDQPYSNHNGGQVSFGPDGLLYIATGDGGGGGDPQGNAQDRTNLLGKILRIDVDRQEGGLAYSIPGDNPFKDNTQGYREEIYAYGLRNPWRFSFDIATGNLWAADVGQNRIEEINIIEKGKNYGWNIMEGSLCFEPPVDCDPSGLELPVFEYEHPLGRSITGGYVYRGADLPLIYGAYIYGDFITGLIWSLWYEPGGQLENYLLTDTGLSISSFGIDEQDELYLSAFDGRIYNLSLLP